MKKKSIVFVVFSVVLIFVAFPADVGNYYDTDGESLSIVKITRSQDGKVITIGVRNYAREDIVIYQVDYGTNRSFNDSDLNKWNEEDFLIISARGTTDFILLSERGVFAINLPKIKVYAKTCIWE